MKKDVLKKIGLAAGGLTVAVVMGAAVLKNRNKIARILEDNGISGKDARRIAREISAQTKKTVRPIMKTIRSKAKPLVKKLRKAL